MTKSANTNTKNYYYAKEFTAKTTKFAQITFNSN